MSGAFDNFVITRKLVDVNDVQKQYKIRLCKDRTITFTKRNQKPFNKVAIAVISVATLQEAESFITFVGTLQYKEHPLMPGKPWHKFMPDMEYGCLEFEDLPRMATKLKQALDSMKEFQERRRLLNEMVV